jgi:hypothetical protein
MAIVDIQKRASKGNLMSLSKPTFSFETENAGAMPLRRRHAQERAGTCELRGRAQRTQLGGGLGEEEGRRLGDVSVAGGGGHVVEVGQVVAAAVERHVFAQEMVVLGLEHRI